MKTNSQAAGGDSTALPLLNIPYTIRFREGRAARAIRVHPTISTAKIVRLLRLQSPRPMLFVSGGATDMSSSDIQETRDIMQTVVARFAHERSLGVVDGGTASGVMAMMGAARRDHGYDFPLIGVSPLGLIAYPGYHNPKKEADLDSGHSHFVLIDSAEWGDETELYMALTHTLAGDRPRMGVLANGGQITRKEAYLATCVYDMQILVLADSGRFADELAAAVKRGASDNPTVRKIIRSGNVQVVSIHDGVEAVWDRLAAHFNKER
jgi:hypothetical protein